MPKQVLRVVKHVENLLGEIGAWQESPSWAQLGEMLSAGDPDRLPLFKQMILCYRRHRAASTEMLVDKTFHRELTESLEQEVNALDALVATEWFHQLGTLPPLPKLKDFLPVQYIEAVMSALELAPRQFDEKFHILQAPSLFFPDLAYFRAKCEEREAPVAIAFLDIDSFKDFNRKYTETKVDRTLLPRFMQVIEAHVFHHGYAYRQGGDEYLLIIPSLSRALAVEFLDELRNKLANLAYPDIEEKTTVSIGLCIAESDCPCTDRELLARANQAKEFAKSNGRNCIAAFRGPGPEPEELHIVRR
ncbi:MAG: GGDEF domain-containing protein [Gemmataceae bacterium]|nr:GGDEF domain-containing protein [Gemmataceae bacterium]